MVADPNTYRVALEHVDEVVYKVRAQQDEAFECRLEFINGRAQPLMGRSAQEFIDDPSLWYRSIHPDDVERVRSTTLAIFMDGHPTTRTYRLQHGVTGEYRWFEDRIVPHHDAGGAIDGLVGVARDVTERIERERDDRAAEARYRAIMEAGVDVILAVDASGRITLVNQQAYPMFGYHPAELIGEPVDRLLPDGLRDSRSVRHGPQSETAGTGERASCTPPDVCARRKDGGMFPVDVSLTPIESNGESLTRAAIRDLTRIRQLEERVRQAEKMEAVGRLAGGVAHDFNNLLTVIIGCADLLLSQIPGDAPARDELLQILEAADRAAALTQQLLAFGRRQMLLPAVISLHDIVSEMTPILRRVIPEPIVITVATEPHLGLVKADRSQMEQIILNLVLNARDAMAASGGLMTIATANAHVGAADVGRADQRPGAFVRLAVSDSGDGMDSDTQSKIFEPFFTTKDMGKGTGLGLSTVYGIVDQSGGWIEVDSEVGRGTTFSVFLPRVNAPATPSA